LDSVRKKGNNLEVGATVKLQQLLESEYVPEALQTALKLEAPLNLRNAATVAGTLVAADGRSTFTAALLAVDAKLTLVNPASENANLGDFLPLRPDNLRGKLITQLEIPLNVKLAFESVARLSGQAHRLRSWLSTSGRSWLAAAKISPAGDGWHRSGGF
jgi:CO/xanthine dehydrogenase FAD-binding subunit